MKRREFLGTTALGIAASMINGNTEKVSAQTSLRDFRFEEATIAQLQAAMQSGRLSAEDITEEVPGKN